MTNIEELNKQPSTVNPTMNELLPMDLSSIQASVSALSESVGKFVAERQAIADAVPKPVAIQPEPAKTGLLGAVRPKVEMPKRDLATDMAEYEQVKQAALAASGIGQQQFEELNQVNAEAMTLSKELERLNLEEQQRIYQATGGFQLSGIKGAAENEIKRQMGLEKSNVAYQLSVKLGQASLIQGRIDKAEASFEQAMNYATYKQDQAIADYKWALGFDLELEKADRDYLQQQIDNTYKERADIRAQKQLELDQMRTQYSMRGSEPKPIKLTGFGSRLQEAINSGLSPEQAARAVWAEDGVENYGVSWNDLVAEAMSLTGQAPVMEETGTGGEWMSPEAQVFGMGNFSNISINDRISQLKSMNFDKAMIRGQLREDGYPENEINRNTGNIIDKAAQAGSDLLSWVSKLFK